MADGAMVRHQGRDYPLQMVLIALRCVSCKYCDEYWFTRPAKRPVSLVLSGGCPHPEHLTGQLPH